jgi:hypothetical protein
MSSLIISILSVAGCLAFLLSCIFIFFWVGGQIEIEDIDIENE